MSEATFECKHGKSLDDNCDRCETIIIRHGKKRVVQLQVRANDLERKYDAAPIESLAHFTVFMAQKLQDNDYKASWTGCTPKWLLNRLRQETKELERAIKKGNAREIHDEAADVANFAMMISDVKPVKMSLADRLEITKDHCNKSNNFCHWGSVDQLRMAREQSITVQPDPTWRPETTCEWGSLGLFLSEETGLFTNPNVGLCSDGSIEWRSRKK